MKLNRLNLPDWIQLWQYYQDIKPANRKHILNSNRDEDESTITLL